MMKTRQIDTILDRLLSITDTSLRSIQLSRCPHKRDLGLVRIQSREYWHMDKRHISAHEVFRIDRLEDIRLGEFPPSFNGPVLDFFNLGIVKPFMIFVNGEHIDPKNLRIITDSRHHYLEMLGFGGIEYVMTSTGASTYNGDTVLRLPKVHPGMTSMQISVDSANPSNLLDLKLNGNRIYQNVSIPEEHLRTDGHNELTVSAQNCIISRITFRNTQRHRVDISTVECVVFPDETKILDTVNTDHGVFSMTFIGGMHWTRGQIASHRMSSSGTVYIPTDKFKPELSVHTGVSDPHIVALVPPDRKVVKETVHCFVNGYPAEVVELGANRFRSSEGGNWKIYHFMSHSNSDNMVQYSKLTNVLSHIVDQENYGHLDTVRDPLDFTFSTQLSQEQRIMEVVEDVVKYNSTLLQDYVDMHSNVKQITMTGAELLASEYNVGGTVVYKLPKRLLRKYRRDCIAFINGFLHDISNFVRTQENIEITFTGLTADDTVELLIFERTYNDVVPFTMASETDKFLLSNYFPMEDIIVQTHDIDYHIYNNIPRREELQYEIEGIVSDLGDGYVGVELNDYYYGRPLRFSSRRKFMHAQYTITGDELMVENLYKILVPDHFRYCSNRNQFLLFHNRRKINSSDAVVCLNHPNLPFDKRFIHLNKQCQTGDIIDIYYLPEEMREVATANTVDERGWIDIPKHQSGYNLDGQHFSFFLNGRKILHTDIVDAGSESVRLTDNHDSRLNLSVLQHIPYRDDIFDTISAFRDSWSEMLLQLTPEARDELFAMTSTLTDTEPDYRLNSYTKEQVLYEVLRRYWLINEHRVKVVNPIFYTYMKNGVWVLPIDSSRTMIDVPLLVAQTSKNKTVHINDNGSESLPLDAETMYLDSDIIDNSEYHYFYDSNTIVLSVLDGTLYTKSGERVLDILLAQADASMILQWNGEEYIPIDAAKIYEIVADLDIDGGNVSGIDAEIIRPWYFDKLITVPHSDRIRPIPMDATLEHIRELPPLIKDI